MTTLHQAAQQALERLRMYHHRTGFAEDAECIDDLEAALVETAEFDVRRILLAVVPGDGNGEEIYAKTVADVEAKLAAMSERIEDLEDSRVRTAPPYRKPLTQKEMRNIIDDNLKGGCSLLDVVRAVEAAHGIKEES